MFLLFIFFIFNNFFIIPIVKENTKVKLVLPIPTETPITFAKEMINIPPLVEDNVFT